MEQARKGEIQVLSIEGIEPLLITDDYISTYITFERIESHSCDFSVYYAMGNCEKNKITEDDTCEFMFDCYFKFDGCAHYNFGDKDGYLMLGEYSSLRFIESIKLSNNLAINRMLHYHPMSSVRHYQSYLFFENSRRVHVDEHLQKEIQYTLTEDE